MNLTGGASRLAGALRKFRLCWDENEARWKDKVRADFEKNRIEEMEQEILTILREHQVLCELLAKAEQECRSPEGR